MDKVKKVFEKISVGPYILEDVNLKNFTYISPKILKTQAKMSLGIKKELATMPSKWKTEGIITRPLKGTFGKEHERNLMRHELTHYIRSKKGKTKGVGESGLKNVLRTIREEAIAYKKGFDAFKYRSIDEKLLPIVRGIIGSTKAAYPKGILRAIFKK